MVLHLVGNNWYTIYTNRYTTAPTISVYWSLQFCLKKICEIMVLHLDGNNWYTTYTYRYTTAPTITDQKK